MHRVLPGCTYGLIPKVQGALDVDFVKRLCQLWLEPRAHSTRKIGFHAASKREAKRTQGRQVSYTVFRVRHTLH